MLAECATEADACKVATWMDANLPTFETATVEHDEDLGWVASAARK